MKAVYVISTQDRIPKNLFKVGRTTQTQDELRRRYLTALITPTILCYLPVEDEIEAEKNLHQNLSQYRVENSEWFHCELGIILQQICHLQTSKNLEGMTDDRKLMQWLNRETSLVDFIITEKNPLVGFYRIQVNAIPQNFWLGFKGRKELFEVLREYVRKEAPFWIEKQELDENIKNISPIDLISNGRVSALYRSRLHYREINKAFLDFCIDCILSLCYKEVEMNTRFSSFKDKQGKEENRIFYLDDKKKKMVKYITLSSSTEENLVELDLEESKHVVIFNHPELPLPQPPPSLSLLDEEENKEKVLLFYQLMKTWISNEEERERFRKFGRNCFTNAVRGKHIQQKSGLDIKGLMFDQFSPFPKDKEGEGEGEDGLNIDYEADNTLVSEYLASVLAYFFPKSVVRLFGQDTYSWENVRLALQELSEDTPMFPKMVIIYSSVLHWSTELNFKTMEVNVSHRFSQEMKKKELVKSIPNYVIVSPQSSFDTFSGVNPSMISSPDLTTIEQFHQEHPSFLEEITSPELMWTALSWFF